jgi:CheY-like chemotaxis protein
MKNPSKFPDKARRILIAEDDDEFRKLLVQSFRKQGYEVTECRHGVDLIGELSCLKEPARPEDFDLIVSDIRMPGVTGLSVLEGLHEFKHAPPVILITAFGDEQTHAAAKRLGAAAMIDKPFEMEDLLAQAAETLGSSAV